MQLSKTLVNIPEYPVINGNALSLFKGKLTVKTVIEQNIKIAKAFPDLPDTWFELFNERIKENKFTDDRLIQSVKYVIDTFSFKTPNIANFISFDKKIEILTEREMTQKADKEGVSIRNYYGLIDIGGKPYYTLKVNIEEYKLKEFELKVQPRVRKYYKSEPKKIAISIKQAFEQAGLSNNVVKTISNN